MIFSSFPPPHSSMARLSRRTTTRKCTDLHSSDSKLGYYRACNRLSMKGKAAAVSEAQYTLHSMARVSLNHRFAGGKWGEKARIGFPFGMYARTDKDGQKRSWLREFFPVQIV